MDKPVRHTGRFYRNGWPRIDMPTDDTLVMICEGNQSSIVCLADGSELLDTYPVEVKEQTST